MKTHCEREWLEFDLYVPVVDGDALREGMMDGQFCEGGGWEEGMMDVWRRELLMEGFG